METQPTSTEHWLPITAEYQPIRVIGLDRMLLILGGVHHADAEETNGKG
jgi:hypothetical protein